MFQGLHIPCFVFHQCQVDIIGSQKAGESLAEWIYALPPPTAATTADAKKKSKPRVKRAAPASPVGSMEAPKVTSTRARKIKSKARVINQQEEDGGATA